LRDEFGWTMGEENITAKEVFGSESTWKLDVSFEEKFLIFFQALLSEIALLLILTIFLSFEFFGM
jgi:hypothetical protein